MHDKNDHTVLGTAKEDYSTYAYTVSLFYPNEMVQAPMNHFRKADCKHRALAHNNVESRK